MRGKTVLGEKPVAQCPKCFAIKQEVDGGKRHVWQKTFAVFDTLPKETCFSCVEKRVDMGITHRVV